MLCLSHNYGTERISIHSFYFTFFFLSVTGYDRHQREREREAEWYKSQNMVGY